MCFQRADQVVQETERRWAKTYSAVYGVDIDTANTNLDDRIAGLNIREVCCADVLVALADDVDRWEEILS